MKTIASVVATFGLLLPFMLPSASADNAPIRIRMISAAFSYFNNPDPNGGSLITSSAGFDIVWNMQRFDDFLYGAYTTQELAGVGGMTYTPASGGASVSGNFSFNPDTSPYLEIGAQTSPIVTLKIAGPHVQGNQGGLDALLKDRTPGLPFIAQVPYAGVFLGGGTVTTSSSSWTPSQPLLPNESNPDTLEQQRSGYAVVQFSTRSLPRVLPFTFVYDGTRDGTTSRIVFFGRIEVSESPLDNSLAPIDPLTLGGYTPPTAGNPPADPPSDLTPPDAADFTKWIKNLFPSLSKSIQSAVGKIHGGPSPLALPTAANAKAKSKSIVTKVSPAAPFNGSVQLAVVLARVGTKKAPPFPAKSTRNVIIVGTKKLEVVINPVTHRKLKQGKPTTVFILAKVTPAGGKPTVLAKRFTLKAR